jgi:hypothetical protein
MVFLTYGLTTWAQKATKRPNQPMGGVNGTSRYEV